MIPSSFPFSTVGLSVQDAIAPLCEQFEVQLRNGQKPSIDRLIAEATAEQRSLLLFELLRLELAYSSPALDDAEMLNGYLKRFPNDVDIVRKAFNQRTDKCPVPPVVDPYRIEKYIACGRFSTVWLARDPNGQAVAIKVPKPEAIATPEKLERFGREARTLQALKHPGIIPILAVACEADKPTYIVMPYMEGTSLSTTIKGHVSPNRMVDILARVADALDYAHQKGWYHRDLKPENILLDAHGNPLVADFGVALHESEQNPQSRDYAGTPHFMSPEQIRRETHLIDGRSDIWALGVILYNALTGRVPFDGQNWKEIGVDILERSPRPPDQVKSKIPPSFRESA